MYRNHITQQGRQNQITFSNIIFTSSVNVSIFRKELIAHLRTAIMAMGHDAVILSG